MQLTLTLAGNQAAVQMDSVLSHTSLLADLRPSAQDAEIRTCRLEDSVALGKLLFTALFLENSAPCTALGDRPSRLLLVAEDKALLKKTSSGNPFRIFGKPDIEIRAAGKDYSRVELCGLDIYDLTTDEMNPTSVDNIACWFVEINYNEESFSVRYACSSSMNKPYEELKRTYATKPTKKPGLAFITPSATPSQNRRPARFLSKSSATTTTRC